MSTFTENVWKKCSEIPKGKVTTYQELARALRTNAHRAVGTALGKNPYAPRVPCHRVVCSDGRIGNYSGRGGMNGKINLLRKEGIIVRKNKIELSKFLYRFKQERVHI